MGKIVYLLLWLSLVVQPLLPHPQVDPFIYTHIDDRIVPTFLACAYNCESKAEWNATAWEVTE